MDEANVARLAALFDRALELPASERAAFVTEACGTDHALLAELTSLLAADESAADYFSDMAAEIVAPAYHAMLGPTGAARESELVSRLQAALADSYQLERELGGGAMSRVLLAEELQLGRKVVIKVLAPAMAASVSAERFRREIQLVAQLQHPHIVPLLTSDMADSLLYYTMPFVTGESLHARLARDGALSIRDARAIWRDVLEALAHAHASGVVHRDIKPGNILLTAGNALVSDFGIARAIEATAGNATETAPGFTIGTPAYMAPEQLTGDRGMDYRVDIYAAGLVMYEMLEGRLPFAGDSDREMILSRLTRHPSPVTRPDCPHDLAVLVGRCLEESPAARPPTAEAVLAALELIPTASEPARTAQRVRTRLPRLVMWLGAGMAALIAVSLVVLPWMRRTRATVAAGATTTSIAVLPLTNFSTDPEDSTLADGMTQALTATLSGVRGLRVIGGRSVFVLRDQRIDARQMAESLHVTNVVEGGFQKVGQRVRMQVRLVDARDNAVRWSASYDREMREIFDVQDSISRALARTLGAGGRGHASPRRYLPRIEAYSWYLRALALSEATTPERRRAREYLNRAVEADSSFAAPYARLAEAYLGDVGTTPGMEHDLLAGAEQAALKAVALDDSLAEAHAALGWARMLKGPRPEMPALRDWAAAETEFRKATALDARFGSTWSPYGLAAGLSFLYMWTGRPAEQLKAARARLEIDPFDYSAIRGLALALSMNGRCDEAVERLRPLQSVRAPGNIAGVVTGQCYAAKRMWPEAIAEFRWAEQSGARTALSFQGYTLARAGRREEATKVLSDLLTGRKYSHGAFGIGIVYAGLGNLDEAFAWLNKAVDEGTLRHLIMLPMFEDLHRDPRFSLLIGRLGL